MMTLDDDQVDDFSRFIFFIFLLFIFVIVVFIFDALFLGTFSASLSIL